MSFQCHSWLKWYVVKERKEGRKERERERERERTGADFLFFFLCK
jgi:hypothetical protein